MLSDSQLTIYVITLVVGLNFNSKFNSFKKLGEGHVSDEESNSLWFLDIEVKRLFQNKKKAKK